MASHVARPKIERKFVSPPAGLPGKIIELVQGVKPVAERIELGLDAEQCEGDIVERRVLDWHDHRFTAAGVNRRDDNGVVLRARNGACEARSRQQFWSSGFLEFDDRSKRWHADVAKAGAFCAGGRHHAASAERSEESVTRVSCGFERATAR